MPRSRREETSAATPPAPALPPDAARAEPARPGGWLGPFRVFDTPTCARLVRELAREPPPRDWFKGRAATSRLFYELATSPEIVDRVEALIGGDLVLWGARLASRHPGQSHPWHTDVETSGPTGRAAFVWVGLQNTERGSSPRFVPGSHRFGRCIQECAAREGLSRGDADDADVLRWARRLDPASSIEQPPVTDGEALVLDGRIWHATTHTGRRGTRVALILNYATPETPIRIPDPLTLDWPFRAFDEPRPPCIQVRGSSPQGVNQMIAGPSHSERGSASRLSVRAHTLELPLADDPERGFKPHPVFRGSTAALETLDCHVSVLSPGHTPHPPHTHRDEEILVVLDGEAELVIVDDATARAERCERARTGTFAYYPAGQRHTIRNPATRPVTYLMFKWCGEPGRKEGEHLPTSIRNVDRILGEEPKRSTDGWTRWHVFGSPTRYLASLRCHLSTLAPGAGYDPHVDAYDVALVVLRGHVETVGERVGPTGVVFYGAGESHGIRNVGDVDAVYLVFEWHAAGARAARWRHARSWLPHAWLRRWLGRRSGLRRT